MPLTPLSDSGAFVKLCFPYNVNINDENIV